jgi:cell division protein FtsL
MKKPLLILTLAVLMIITLSVLRVVVTNSLSTTGIDLSKMQEQIRDYKRENALMKEKILEKSSLTFIREEAQKRGFVRVKDIVHMGTPLPLALKQ